MRTAPDGPSSVAALPRLQMVCRSGAGEPRWVCDNPEPRECSTVYLGF
jgi:hypothetical protein